MASDFLDLIDTLGFARNQPLLDTSGTTATNRTSGGSTGTYVGTYTLANAAHSVRSLTPANSVNSASRYGINLGTLADVMPAAITAGALSFGYWFRSSTGAPANHHPFFGSRPTSTATGPRLYLLRNSATRYTLYMSTPTSTTEVTGYSDNVVNESLVYDGNDHLLVFVLTFDATTKAYGLSMYVDGNYQGCWNLGGTAHPVSDFASFGGNFGLGTCMDGAAQAVFGTSGTIGSMSFGFVKAGVVDIETQRHMYDRARYRTRPPWRVNEATCKNPSEWVTLFNKARTQPSTVALVGTSKLTTPGGQGYFQINGLMASGAKRFGYSNGSIISPFTPAGYTPGLAVTVANQPSAVGSLTAELPPTFIVYNLLAPAFDYSQQYFDVNLDGLALPTSESFVTERLPTRRVDYSKPFVLDIWLRKSATPGNYTAELVGENTSSGGTATIGGYAKQRGVRITATAAELTGSGEIVQKTSAPFYLDNGRARFMHRGDHASNGVQVVGYRLRQPTGVGRLYYTFSAGGYTMATHTNNAGAHVDSAKYHQAFGVPDWVEVWTDHNDAYSGGKTTAQMIVEATDFIALMRTRWNAPNLPVMLCTSTPFWNGSSVTAAKDLEFDELPHAYAALAASMDHVFAKNVWRRLYDFYGAQRALYRTRTTWAVTTGYVVGDRVQSLGGNAICIAAHVDGANMPMNGTYWRPDSEFDGDYIHETRWGGLFTAEAAYEVEDGFLREQTAAQLASGRKMLITPGGRGPQFLSRRPMAQQ